MAQLMDLQDEYRRNRDFLEGYRTAEDKERDFRAVVNAKVKATVEKKTKEAVDKRNREIAIKMLQDKKPIKEVVKYTQLPENVVMEIKDGLSL